MSLVRRYPLITFFLLAYALSWWPWILYALDLSPQPIVGFGPFLAAIVVLAISRGKTGVVGLLRRMVRWRVGLRWYAVALLLPVAISLAAAVFNVLLGAQAPSSVELGGWVASSRRSSFSYSFPASMEYGRSRAGEATPCRACKSVDRHSLPA